MYSGLTQPNNPNSKASFGFVFYFNRSAADKITVTFKDNKRPWHSVDFRAGLSFNLLTATRIVNNVSIVFDKFILTEDPRITTEE